MAMTRSVEAGGEREALRQVTSTVTAAQKPVTLNSSAAGSNCGSSYMFVNMSGLFGCQSKR